MILGSSEITSYSYDDIDSLKNVVDKLFK